MKTLNFIFVSFALFASTFVSAQTIVINMSDKDAVQEFIAEVNVNFENEWTSMIATLEAEMNSIGLLEVNSTYCCPAAIERKNSFSFMGESFPEVSPSLNPMVDAIDTPVASSGIQFLGEQFPELPAEDMIITEQRDGSFYFMNEKFPALPAEKNNTPLL